MQKVTSQFQNDLKTVSDKVNSMEKSYSEVARPKEGLPEEKLQCVIINLPDSETENILAKVNGLVKDGLKLNNVNITAANRMKSYKRDVSGIVIVKFTSVEDKKRDMEKKGFEGFT